MIILGSSSVETECFDTMAILGHLEGESLMPAFHSSTPRKALGTALFAGAGLLLADHANAEAQPPEAEPALSSGPSEIVFEEHNLFPEGIAYDQTRDEFLVSSLYFGGIYRVSLEGDIQPFVEDERLISTFGLHLDTERNRVLVCNSDLGVGERTAEDTKMQVAELAIYDLATGEPLRHVDLTALHEGAAHFCNDVIVGPDGTAYVTNSLSPVIYRVPLDGEPDVLTTSELFEGEGVNLNGLVYHPDGYLIVAKYNDGTLLRVSLDDPSDVQQVELDRTFEGADGMVWDSQGKLVLAANAIIGGEVSTDAVVQLSSEDGWQSAHVSGRMDTGAVFVTTAAQQGDDTYVLYAKLDQLFTGKLPVERFSIRRVDFEAQ
ncbi:hypothetical protein QLQ85_16905 [Halomonas sp. M4R5S39]|uniref:hypothetical protein n=1 Tax=Halomonas kalidii TaxID=3043293 RepID=UPI0024A7B2EE|nr:hypothetical protein [Halomonas kalidii]MDI5986474.1 hypothetical protein [Halomonas kalidii]